MGLWDAGAQTTKATQQPRLCPEGSQEAHRVLSEGCGAAPRVLMGAGFHHHVSPPGFHHVCGALRAGLALLWVAQRNRGWCWLPGPAVSFPLVLCLPAPSCVCREAPLGWSGALCLHASSWMGGGADPDFGSRGVVVR